VDFIGFDSFWGINKFLERSFLCGNKVWLGTNGGGRWPRHVSLKAKIFARSLLQPCDELVSKLEDFAGAEYSIIHFRLGDEEMSVGRSDGFERELALLKRHMRPTDILLTDSHAFKTCAHNDLGIRVIPTVPVHVGVSGTSAGYLDTLFEFFLVTQAKSIKTYSVYPWISGFVLSVSKIYGVPLYRLGNTRHLKWHYALRHELGTTRDDLVLGALPWISAIRSVT